MESGETVEQAAKRELTEEAGVTAHELSLRGKLIFHVPSYPSTMVRQSDSRSGLLLPIRVRP